MARIVTGMLLISREADSGSGQHLAPWRGLGAVFRLSSVRAAEVHTSRSFVRRAGVCRRRNCPLRHVPLADFARFGPNGLSRREMLNGVE